MRAIAVVPGRREVALVDHPEPELSGRTKSDSACSKWVCVAPTARSVPSSTGPRRRFEHLVIGHESVAEVLEVGPKVTLFRPGDLVVPTVRRPCPHEAAPLLGGHQDFCSTGTSASAAFASCNGFMTEQVVDHERWLVRVPPACATWPCSWSRSRSRRRRSTSCATSRSG